MNQRGKHKPNRGHGGHRYPAQPPPPYQQHAPGSVAYIPVRIPVLPVPQPQPQPAQPTTIINHIHNHPAPVVRPTTPTPPSRPPSVTVIKDPVTWVQATTDTAHSIGRALQAGREGWDGSALYIIRTSHQGELVPGKLAINHKAAYIPYSGKEIPVRDFEILCAAPQSICWTTATNGRVPSGAVAAGKSRNGEVLYIGRATHRGSLTPGKVHPSHGCCYISFGGNEVVVKEYEVLCRAQTLR